MNGYGIIIVAVLAALLAAFATYEVKNEFDKVAEQKALQAQSDALGIEFNKEKAITERANNDLQKANTDISTRLNSLLLQQPARCIVPVTQPAKPAAGGQSKHAGRNGVSTDWLRKYAARCEQYRSEVTVLGGFITDTWKLTTAH